MYIVIRVERCEGGPDGARVLSTHRSLADAEQVKDRVQQLVQRARQAGESDLKPGDIRIICSLGHPLLGTKMPARQLKQMLEVSPVCLPA